MDQYLSSGKRWPKNRGGGCLWGCLWDRARIASQNVARSCVVWFYNWRNRLKFLRRFAKTCRASQSLKPKEWIVDCSTTAWCPSFTLWSYLKPEYVRKPQIFPYNHRTGRRCRDSSPQDISPQDISPQKNIKNYSNMSTILAREAVRPAQRLEKPHWKVRLG